MTQEQYNNLCVGDIVRNKATTSKFLGTGSAYIIIGGAASVGFSAVRQVTVIHPSEWIKFDKNTGEGDR
jgi:hypothetical protein